MHRSRENLQPAVMPAEDVDEAISRVAEMNVSELRSVWRDTFGSEPPSAFSKDLLARAIAYRLQEEAYGGWTIRLNGRTQRVVKSGLF
jgi:hypothetical protein